MLKNIETKLFNSYKASVPKRKYSGAVQIKLMTMLRAYIFVDKP